MSIKKKSFVGVIIILAVFLAGIALNVFVNASNDGRYVLEVMDNGSDKSKSDKNVIVSQQILENESNDKEMTYQFNIKNKREKRTRVEIALVVDTSYSMVTNAEGKNVKQKATEMVTYLKNSMVDRNVFFSLSNNAGIKSGLTGSEASINNTINSLIDGEGSNLADGLQNAYNTFSNTANTDRFVVYITDATDDTKDQLINIVNNEINVIGILVDMTNNIIGTPNNSNYGRLFMFDSVTNEEILEEIGKPITGIHADIKMPQTILDNFDVELVETPEGVTLTEKGISFDSDIITALETNSFKYKLILKDNVKINNNLVYKTWYSNDSVEVTYRSAGVPQTLTTEKEDSPTFTICETYKLKIKAVSSDDKNLAVQGIKFKIVGINEENKEVYHEVLTTDANGYVTALGLKELGKVTYSIKPIVDLFGYDKTDETRITVENDYLGTGALKVETDGLDYKVSDANRIVDVTMPINVKSFKLEIDLSELDNNTVPLSDVEFRLIQPKVNSQSEMNVLYGTTNQDGKLILKPTMMTKAGTYDYVLTQTSEKPGYESMGNVSLRITFNNKGEVTEATKVYNDKVEVSVLRTDHVKLMIENKSALVDPFNFELNLADSVTGLPVSGATYNINVINSDGSSYNYGQNITNAEGKIEIQLPGTGYVTLKVTEVSPATGYAKDTQTKEVLIQRINGEVRYIISKTPSDLDVINEAVADKVTMNLKSTLKTERNVVKVSVFDKEEIPDFAIEEVSFELVNNVNGKTYGPAKTDIEGNVSFTIDEEEAGSYDYSLKVLEAPYGYIIPNESINFNMTFDANKHIISSNAVSGEIDTIETNVITNDTDKLYQTAIRTNLAIDSSNAYYFEIQLLDVDDNEIKIEGATYDLEISAGNFVRTVKGRPTDANGKILTRIPVDKNLVNEITIVATEVGSKRGYKADSIPQEITLNLTNNSITHTPDAIIPGSGVEGLPKYAEFVEGNKVLYHHTNRKKTSADTILNLSLTTIDKTSNTTIGGKNVTIKNVKKMSEDGREVKITDSEGNELDMTGITSTVQETNGYISFNGLKIVGAQIPGEEVYEMDIIIDGNLIKTKLTFRYNEERDMIEVINVEVVWGNRLIQSRNFSSAETEKGYESDVNLEVYSNYDSTGNLSLDLVKKSLEDREALQGAYYDIVIERPDGTRLVKSHVLVTDKIEFDGIYVPLNSNIFITETTAPVGYDLNDTVILKVTAIDEITGEITLEEDSNAGDYDIPRTNLIQEPSTTLGDGTIQSVYQLELFDVQKDIFAFKVNTINSEGQGVRGEQFKISNDKGAQKTTAPTGEEGFTTTKIGGKYDDVNSPRVYTVENVKAGMYYKKLETPLQVNVYFKADGSVDAATTMNGQTDSNYVVNGTNPGQWYFVSTNHLDNEGNVISDIEIKVIVEEQDPLNVEIQTVDKFTGQEITADFDYAITTQIGTFTGKDKLEVKYALSNETQTYNLVQNMNTYQYIGLTGLQITIVYDEAGDIISAITNSENVEIIATKGKTIQLKVKVEPAVPFVIEDSYYFDTKIKLQGSEFKVTNSQKVQIGLATTDINGKAIDYLGAFGTSETIRYTIEQTKAATGYATVAPFEIDVDYNENREITGARLVENSILLSVGFIQPSTSSDEGYNGNANGIVTLQVKSYPEFIMNIENVDRQDNTKKLAGTNYKVTSEIPTADESTVTDANGLADAQLDRTVFGNKVVYTIEELSPSVGYQSLAIPAKVEVTFDQNGYASVVNVIASSDVTTASLPTIVDDKDHFRVNVVIKNNPSVKIDIHKKDKDTNDSIANVDFEVTARIEKSKLNNYTQEEIEYLTVETAELTEDQYLGEVIDRLKIDPEDIDNRKKEIAVQIYIDHLKDNDLITQEEYEKVVAGVNGTDKINILISLNKLTKSQSNQLVLVITNEQVIHSLINEGITTQDRVNALLTNVKGLVRLDVKNVTTDQQGNVVAYMDKGLANKTIEYTIKETRKADGYDWPDEVVILEVTYDADGNIVENQVRKVAGAMDVTAVDVNNFRINVSLDNEASQEVRIHLNVEDVYDRDKKLEVAEYNAYLTDTTQGASYIRDDKYATTLASGGIYQNGSVVAHGEDISSIGIYKEGAGTRVLRLDEIVAPTKYYLGNEEYESIYESIEYKLLFNVTFNDEGSITDVSLHSPGGLTPIGWVADGRYIAITHTRNTINITVRYYPMVGIQLQAPDKYTGESLEAKINLSTSYNIVTSQSDVVKSGYIGYGTTNYFGKIYSLGYTTDANVANIEDTTRKGVAPIEAETEDSKERIFYLYEEDTPNSPVQYQQYIPRYFTLYQNRLIAKMKATYNDKGEIITVDVLETYSNNNIQDGFVEAILPSISNDKHTIQVKVKYAPITTIDMKAEDTISKAGIAGVTISPYQNDTPVTNISYEYRNDLRYTTGSNGTANWTYWGANIDNGVVVYKIKLDGIKEGYVQYEADKNIEVEVTYGNDGRISSARVLSKNTFDGLNAYIDESCYGTTQLKLIYNLERTFGLQINKKDKFDDNKNLSAKFKITSNLDSSILGDTDFIINTANRTPQIAGRILAGKTVEYTLSETTVPDGYKPLSQNLKLTVKYNTDGTVADAYPSDEFSAKYLNIDYRCVIPRNDNSALIKDLEITVTNEPKMGLEIQLLDKFYSNIEIGDTTFVITNDQGDQAVGNLVTNENGRIVTYVGPVYQDKTVTYTLVQNTKADGYYQLTSSIQFKITYDSAGKAVDIPQFIDSYSQENAKILNTDVSEFRENHTTRLQVYNMPEDVKIGINKFDKLTNAPIANVGFKIKVEENGTSYEINNIKTNSEGIIVQKIDTFKPTDTGRTVVYTIQELAAPDGYRKAQDLKITVTYAPDGSIASWLEQSNNSQLPYQVYRKGNTNISKVDDKYVHIDLKVPNDNAYDLIIKDEDSTYQDLGIEGSKYDVSIKGKVQNVEKTKVDGKTAIKNITENGNVQIRIAENNPGEGYRRNPLNDVTLQVQKSITGEYKLSLDTANMTGYTITQGTSNVVTELVYNILLDADTNTTVQVIVDETFGTIQVIFKNEPMLELTVIQQDVNTKQPISGIELSISSKDLSNHEITLADHVITDAEGKVYVDLGIGHKNTTMVYTIEQSSVPEPYTNTLLPQTITVGFDMYGKITGIYTDSSLRTTAIQENKNDEVTETEEENCRNIVAYIKNGSIDPGYKVKVVSEDNVTGHRINNSIFDVEVTNDASKTLGMISQGKTSNLGIDGEYYSDEQVKEEGIKIVERGSVSTKEPINYQGKIYLNIDQVGFADGYVAGNQKTQGKIELTTVFTDNPDGSLDSILGVTLNNNDGLEVTYDEQAREIIIKVKNEARTQLDLTKVSTIQKDIKDEKGKIIGKVDVPISGASFTVTSEILTASSSNPTDLNLTTRATNEFGKTVESLGTPLNGKTVIYTIHENDLSGYKSLEDIVVYVVYDAKGYIKYYELLSNYTDATIEGDWNGSRILQLKVKNQPIIKDYKIVIQKHNIDDGLYPDLIPGVEFNIKVEEEYGRKTQWDSITNENGEINSDFFDGYGNIKVALTETASANGYKLDSATKYIFLIRNKDTGVIEKVSSDVNIEIDQENAVIYLKPVNDFAENTYSLAIDKVDATTGDRILNNPAKFDVKITKEDQNGCIVCQDTIEDLKTDATGRIRKFNLPVPPQEGAYIYEFKEREVPNGYAKDPEEIKFRVVFEETAEGHRYIKTVEKISGKYASTMMVKNQSLAIQIGNMNGSEIIEDDKYGIDITKVDSQTLEPIKNETIIDEETGEETSNGKAAIFKITYSDGKVEYKETDEDGRLGIIKISNLTEPGEVIVKIQEIMAPEGYVLNKEEIQVKLTYDYNADNELVVTKVATKGDSVNAPTVESEQKMSMNITNEKGTNTDEGADRGFYSIILNKIDAITGKPIEGQADFEVALANGQKVVASTDDKSKIQILDIKAPSKAGTYSYVITEKKAPEGYILHTDPVIVEMDFVDSTEDPTKLVISDVRIVNSPNATQEVNITVSNTTQFPTDVVTLDVTNSSDIDKLYVTSDVYGVYNEAFTGKEYSLENPFIDDIVEPKTTIDQFINNLESNGNLKVLNADGSELASTQKFVGTGMILEATKGNQKLTYTIIVKGDIFGNGNRTDGRISNGDSLLFKQYFSKLTSLDPAYIRAIDFDNNGRISNSDSIRFQDKMSNP